MFNKRKRDRARSIRWIGRMAVVVAITTSGLAAVPAPPSEADTGAVLGALPAPEFPPRMPLPEPRTFYVPPPEASASIVPGLAPLPPPAVEPLPAPPSRAEFLPGISQELPGERAENIDVYANPDGTRTAKVYAGPVNWKDGAGNWQKIDERLIPEGDGYRNASGPFTVRFPAVTGSGPVAKIDTGSSSVSFHAPQGTPKGIRADVSDSRITYRDVVPGVDLVYLVTVSTLKELVVLNRKPAGQSPFRFPVSTTNAAVTAKDGGLEFRDGQGGAVASAPVGEMWDSSGSEGPRADVRYRLETVGAAQFVTLEPDAEYLSDPARVYPIYVDPSMSLVGGNDAFVSDAFDNNYDVSLDTAVDPDRYQDKVGNFNEGNQNAGQNISFLRYDVGPLTGKTIQYARWHGYFFWAYSTSPTPYTMRPVNDPWAANLVKWSNRPGPVPGWVVTDVATREQWRDFDITEWVKRWQSHEWGNEGVMLEAGTSTNDWKKLAAHENELGTRSYIEIVYSNTPPLAPTLEAPADGLISRTTPSLFRAIRHDPDNEAGSVAMEIRRTSDNTVVASTTVANVCAGCAAEWTTPPSLPDGHYTWWAQAWDPSSWGPWSAGRTFRVDGANPSNPSDLHSTTHVQGAASTNAHMTFTWQPSTDNGAGVAGYRYLLTTSATAEAPTDGINATDTTKTVSADANGAYYFNVRARDNAGNWSANARVGPYYIETAAPLITKASSTASALRGDVITYTVTVTNPNPWNLEDVTVSDPLPAELAGVAASASWSLNGAPPSPCTTNSSIRCDIAGQTMSVAAFDMDPGAVLALTYKAVALGVDRGCGVVTNTATTTHAAGSPSSSASVNVCGGGLGFESWWSSFSRATGGDSSAHVNPASGNLVVQQSDTTAVQAHGQLGLGLRRTYNSQGAGGVEGPGSIGRGWTLNVAEIGELSDGVMPTALSVPLADVVANPLAMFLIDRDGTRHAFTPKVLPSTSVIDISAGTAPATLAPKALPVPPGKRVCILNGYDAPPGVHLSVWRYIQVDDAAGACAAVGNHNPVVLGFVAVRPDRLRMEFLANGRLLSMIDAAGNQLRYAYDGAGGLKAVYEPVTCPDASAIETDNTTCRRIWLRDVGAERHITDPAGRLVKLIFDNAVAKRLVRVETWVGTSKVAQTLYSYGDCTGAGPDEMCSVTDARGGVTNFTYAPSTLFGTRLASLTERQTTTVNGPGRAATAFGYHDNAPAYTTAMTAEQQQVRWEDIDDSGRVHRVLEGTTANLFTHIRDYDWDVTGSTCRAPDNDVVDNNLCGLFQEGGSSPDKKTEYLYNAEGRVKRERKINNDGTVLDSTFGYRAQYFRADGTVATYNDNVGWSGDVPSEGSPNRADGGTSPTVFEISDLTETLTPEGNSPARASAAGVPGSWTAFKTTHVVDADATKQPSSAPAGTVCASGGPSYNTGLVCETQAPLAGATHYTYDAQGQRVSMTMPKAFEDNVAADARCSAAGAPRQCVSYVYYTDAQLDVSGGSSAGGWLKAVVDQDNHFVAFGHDRAGNAARTWDRNATEGQGLSAYPGTVGQPGPGAYREVLYAESNGYGLPWRYIRSDKQPSGALTTFFVDANGNVGSIRSPRAVAENGPSVSRSFDPSDRLISEVRPEHSGDGIWEPVAKTTHEYDVFGNLVRTTDARGGVVAYAHDDVNRLTSTTWTRGAMPSNPQEIPAGCEQTAVGDGLPAGLLKCSRLVSYDNVDNVTSFSDGNDVVTRFTFDGVHREIKRLAPRTSNTDGRTDTVYNLDGQVLRTCLPREFTLGSNSCGPTARYATHTAYDERGRARTHTTYRDATGPASVTTFGYDADGNTTSVTDPNGHTTTAEYSLLGRKTSESAPRGTGISLTTRHLYDAAGNTTAVVRPPAVNSGTGADGDLVVDGIQFPQGAPYAMADGKDYTSVTLVNGGWIAAPADGTLSFRVKGPLTVCSLCGITATGQGLAGGGGGASTSLPGANGSGLGGGIGGGAGAVSGGGGGGAGHAGAGAAGGVNAGSPGGSGGTGYGDADQGDAFENVNLALGSGGGGGGRGGVSNGAGGGAGGGVIQVTAESVDIQGAVTAAGAPGSNALASGGGGGGGSGGAVWLTAVSGTVSGPLSVAGGSGGAGGLSGGSGASGYVRVDSDTVSGNGIPAQADRHTVARIEAYSFDVDNRLVDRLIGATNTDAAAAGMSDGAVNVRTRRVYDLNGNVAGVYEPRAFQSSATDPDERFLSRAEFDFNGRMTASYTPRYDDSAASDLGLTTTQTSQCPTSVRPTQTLAGVGAYPASVGLCVTRMSYDDVDNLVQVRMPTSTSSTDQRYIAWTYTADNLVRTVDTPAPAGSGQSRAVTTTFYDGEGRPFRTVDPEGEVTATDYTSDGLVKKVTAQEASSTLKHVTTYGYNADGQQNAVTLDDPNQGTSSRTLTTQSLFYHDGLLKSVADPVGNTTLYAYDLRGNVLSVKSPRATANDEPPVLNTYTHDNLIATTTNPTRNDGVDKSIATQARRTTFSYDNGSRTIAQSVHTLDANGSVTASGGKQTFDHSPSERLIRETGRNGDNIVYEHDAAGHTAKVADLTNGGSTLSASYYLDGLLRTVNDSVRTTKSAYDGSGQRVARADAKADGSQYLTKYTYGDAGEQTSLTSDITPIGTASWTYFLDGNVKRETAANSQTVDYTYFADDTLAGQVLKDPSGTTLATWSYQYDQLYRATSQAFTGASAGTGAAYQGTATYKYDRAGRLDEFTMPGKTPTNVDWDADSNRTAMGPSTFTYNPDDSIHTSARQGDPVVRQYDYKVFGGVDTDTCSNYQYDGFDRLAQVSAASNCPAAATTTYAYDGLDRQRSRVEGSTTMSMHYDGLSDQIAIEAEGGVDTAYVLDATGTAKATKKLTSTPTTNYLTTDGTGTVATATNPAGLVRCTARFDPYGTPLDASGNEITGANPCNSGSSIGDLFYRGGRRDKATGNYQFGSRTYDPSKGSFLTPDAFRGAGGGANLGIGVDPLTMNRYSYVNGDPVNLVDPSGHGAVMYADKGCSSDACEAGHSRNADQVKQTVKNLHRHGEATHEVAIPAFPEQKKGCSGWRKAACWVGTNVVALAWNGAVNAAEGVVASAQLAIEMQPTKILERLGTGLVDGGLGGLIDAAVGEVELQAAVAQSTVSGFLELAKRGDPVQAVMHYGGIAKDQGITAAVRAYSYDAGTMAPDVAMLLATHTVRAKLPGRGSIGCNSFVPGTAVVMADGSRMAIETVKVGDLVLAADPETGEQGPRAVSDLIPGFGDKSLVDIEVDGEVVVATDEHPFWVVNRDEWVDAAKLRPGDRLLSDDGDTLAVDDVGFRLVSEQAVHNLTVDDLHTYFVIVGDEPVLTHNTDPACGVGGLGSKKALSGSGPVPGVLEASPRVKSVRAINNWNGDPVEFVFDPESATFAMGRPAGSAALKGSPHQQLASAIDANGNTVVGGTVRRGPGGALEWDEMSGHYWRNWNAGVRQQFVETLRGYGVNLG